MAYVKKTEEELRWDETKKRLRLEGRIVLDRLMNDVLDEASRDREAGQHGGTLMEVPETRAELQAYFRKAAARLITKTVEAPHALPATKR